MGISTIFLFTVIAQVNGYRMVCYYENWAQYRHGALRMMPADIDPTMCTHVIYAFAQIINNELSPYEWNDMDLYAQTAALKSKNPNLKVLLSVGGYNHGTERFSSMVATKENRSHFIDTSVAYLREHRFDGLDLDWEFPGSDEGLPQDKERFAQLCKELKAEFKKESLKSGDNILLLTAAVPAAPEKIMSGYDVPKLSKCLDFINLMTYDFHGPWELNTGHNAPLYSKPSDNFTVSFASKYWNKQGMPADKIVIGLPAYGPEWMMPNVKGEIPPPGTPAYPGNKTLYRNICSNKDSMSNTARDKVARVPYAFYSGIWVSFDDPLSFEAKCSFIKAGSYGGAMLWALGGDDHNGLSCGGIRYPLLASIYNCLKQGRNESKSVPQEAISSSAHFNNVLASTTKPLGKGTRSPRLGSTRKRKSSQKPVASTTPKFPSLSTEGKTNEAIPSSKPEYLTTRKITKSTKPKSKTSISSLSTTPLPTLICAKFTCPESDGFFIDSCDCGSFYRCANGVPYHFNCGKGTLWNAVIKTCDWPQNVSCERIYIN